MPVIGNFGLAESVASGALGRGPAVRSGAVRPFAPTGLDMELIEAADAALAARVPLGVVLPPGSASAPVLLGAAAAVAAILHRGRLNVQVAVASTRLADRHLYDELAFRGQHLARFLPRAGVTGDGRSYVIGRPKPGVDGRLWVVSRADRLAGIGRELEGIVPAAEATTPVELRDLLRRSAARVPVLYLTGDPYDPGLDVVRDVGGVVWAWDAAALPALAEPAARPRTADAGALLAAPGLLRGTAAAEIHVHVPASGGELDAALDELWRATGSLAGVLDTGSAARPVALLWAYRVFHGLAMLPTSPSAFDRHVGANPYQIRFGSAVETARGFADRAPAAGKDAWHRWADALSSALEVAETRARTPQIVDWVCGRVDADAPGTVLTRSATAAAALTTAMHESPGTPLGWDRLIEIRTLAELSRGSIDPAVPLCVPGRLPRTRAGVFAFPVPAGVTVLTCGPLEGRRVLKQATAARARMAELRAETVRVSAPRLNVTPRADVTADDPAAAVRVVEGGELRPLAADEVAGADEPVWYPFAIDVVAALARAAALEGDESPVRNDTADQDTVAAIAVHVDAPDGAQVLLVPANDILTRRCGTSLARVAAKSLTAGDRLLLVDRAARTDLRLALTDKLSERIEYRTLRLVIDFWHDRAAAAGRIAGLTQQGILDRMAGTRITSPATIGSWIRGDVYGPDDDADLARFARAVGDEALLEQAAAVAAALRTLRGVHIKLGFWLAGQVGAAAGRAPEAVVDAELGVRVADLLDTIAEYEVIDVDLTERPTPAHLVGLLIEGQEKG